MDWLTVVLGVLGICFFIKFLQRDYRKSKPPGPNALPIIGSAFELDVSRFHLQAYEFARKHGDITEIKVFNSHIVLLNSADLVYKAFCEEEYRGIFNGRPTYFISDFLYGRSNFPISASQAGKRHSEMRKALTKGLHIYGDGIAKFEDIMQSEIQNMMAKIEQYDGKEFEFMELAKRSISNVISILLTGDQATEEDYASHCDLLAETNYFATPFIAKIMHSFPFLLYIPPFKSRIRKLGLAKKWIIDKILHRTKITRTPGKIRCLVDFYFEEQEREVNEGREPIFTDDVISAVILESFFGGTATTMSGLSSAILFLANHPEYQLKVQEELDTVLGSNAVPVIQDKLDHKCNFLEAVILETLRHTPPGPLLLPHTCSQDIEFEGFQLKRNTQVLGNIFYIHHDEKIWGDPWVFRPDRFLDENGKLLPSSHIYMKSWLPFGTGRRKCPGLSLGTTRMFLYLSHILQKWILVPSKKNTSFDPRNNGYEGGTVLKPKPFYCVAKPRK